jgi:hypothetical protein
VVFFSVIIELGILMKTNHNLSGILYQFIWHCLLTSY